MHERKRRATLLSLVMLALVACDQSVAAERDSEKPRRITIAATHAPTLPWVKALSSFFIPEFDRRVSAVDPNFKVEWIEAYGGSLYKWQDTLEAVEIGLADIAWVGSLWENAKMPLQNITYSLPFISDDLPTGRIMAKDEDVCLHCGLCAERCPTGAWDMQKYFIEMTHAGDANRGL